MFSPSLPRLILDKTGTCIKITAKAESLIWRAERLFFLNGEQDLRAFLLVDLGVVKYPSYKCTISEQIFSGRHSLSELRAVVTCTGGPCLASLCRILAEDYRSWSSGMPDLLLWRFHEEGYRGEVKLVEVKGPRDSLSEQQRAWLLLLMDWGFNAEVCKVSPMPLST
ncbi:Fanconi-associated nuclease 1 homolog [Linum perenne]